MNGSGQIQEKGFDPSRYLTKIPRRMRGSNGSWSSSETDYLEVKWRLLWLRTEHPNSVIDTHLVSHEDGMAIFRARVLLPNGGSATGWGHETAGGFEDYLEKAETKALGRALAALGYGTQFCEDFESVATEEDEGGRAGGPERLGPRATEAQVRAIYAIARGSLGLNEDEIDARSAERYGAAPGELTRRQASEFIDTLKNGASSPQKASA